MGVSSDAMLLYGINMGDPEDVAIKLGWKPDQENPEPDSDWFVEYVEGKLPKCLSMTLGGHPDGCPTWFIAAKCISARRGYEQEVTELPEPSKAAKEALKKFEKLLDLKATCWLVSYADF